MFFSKTTKEMKVRDRAAADFLTCLRKIQKIDQKMKTAKGERLQKLADKKAILEMEMEHFWNVSRGSNIEYRGENQNA